MQVMRHRKVGSRLPSLQKYVLKGYPPLAQKYILRNIVNVRGYDPDITLVFTSRRDRQHSSRLWFDLVSGRDTDMFISDYLRQKILPHVPLADIIIIGMDKTGEQNELFLEFSAKKIEFLKEFVLEIEKQFGINCKKALRKFNAVKGFLDRTNYYIVAFRTRSGRLAEIEFMFNMRKDYFCTRRVDSRFRELFTLASDNAFRGEQSYIITPDGECMEKRGWMIDKVLTECVEEVTESLSDIIWGGFIREKLKWYSQCMFAPYLRLGWFSYAFNADGLQHINLNINAPI